MITIAKRKNAVAAFLEEHDTRNLFENKGDLGGAVVKGLHFLGVRLPAECFIVP